MAMLPYADSTPMDWFLIKSELSGYVSVCLFSLFVLHLYVLCIYDDVVSEFICFYVSMSLSLLVLLMQYLT
jgi:hypothetical protein